MAIQSYTAGYGPQCTMSNNGAGKVRVTYPPDDCDWKLYDDTAVDGSHYIYNQTRTASSAITAKGGTEAEGYYFDTALNFAGTTWVNTDRCAITMQAAANDYLTRALAKDAMAAMDELRTWYATTANYSSWIKQAVVTQHISERGGLAHQRVRLLSQGSNSGWNPTGDLSDITSQLTIQNLTWENSGTGYGYYYSPTAGLAGSGVRITRNVVIGWNSGIILWTNTANNTCQIDNNIVMFSCTSGISLTGTQKVYNNTVAYCMVSGIANSNTASTHTNNLCVYNTTDYATKTNGVYTTCGSTDATGTAGLINLTAAQLALWQNNDNHIFSINPRILMTSALYHTGTAVGGITTDIDGNTRMNPPSIGAHEGTSQAYPAPAGTISGTFTATLHASQNKVTLDLTGLTQTGGIYWVICVRQGSTPVGSEDEYKLYHIPIATTSFDIMQNYDGAQASHASLLYITVQVENTVGVRTALGTAVSVTPHGYLEVND